MPIATPLRHPKGTKQGGQFAPTPTAVTPSGSALSLEGRSKTLSFASKKKGHSTISFSLQETDGIWHVVDTVDTTKLALKTMLAQSNGRDLYEGVMNRLARASVIVDFLNKGYIRPEDLHESYLEWDEYIMSDKLSPRLKLQRMLVRIDLSYLKKEINRWRKKENHDDHLSKYIPTRVLEADQGEDPMDIWGTEQWGVADYKDLEHELKNIWPLEDHLGDDGPYYASPFGGPDCVAALYSYCENFPLRYLKDKPFGEMPMSVLVSQYQHLGSDKDAFKKWLAEPGRSGRMPAFREHEASCRIFYLIAYMNPADKQDMLDTLECVIERYLALNPRGTGLYISKWILGERKIGSPDKQSLLRAIKNEFKDHPLTRKCLLRGMDASPEDENFKRGI